MMTGMFQNFRGKIYLEWYRVESFQREQTEFLLLLGKLKHCAVEQINGKVERQFTSCFIPSMLFFFISKVHGKKCICRECTESDEFKSAIKGQSTSPATRLCVCVDATLGKRAKNQVAGARRKAPQPFFSSSEIMRSRPMQSLFAV